MHLDLHQTLHHAVDQGIEAYITSRRARIPLFIHQHFSFRGALALHRKTFGRDVYKYPVNLMWGLPVALVTGAADLLDKAGATRTAQWLHRMPRGMPTALHQELQWLLYTELLELPYAQEGRASHRDALLEHILADSRIAALCDAYLTHLHGVAEQPVFRAALERHLAEYGKTRGAVSELAGSLINLAAGYAALSKATPGALSVGTAAATAIAQHLAIAHFWLGSTVGSCTCILRVIPNARESGTIPPFSTCVRGHCHDIQPRFLPARAHRPGVVVSDTLWPLAIGACCSAPRATQAADAPGQALHKAHALSGSHP